MGIVKKEVLVFNKMDLLSNPGEMVPFVRKYGAYPLVATDKDSVRSFASHIREVMFGERRWLV